ncbi:MAG TPA: DUF4390 domain-containing protein [Polyangia bacterium]|jgi:hypothetical protein
MPRASAACSTRVRAIRLGRALALMSALGATVARAEVPPPRQVGLAIHDRTLSLSVGLQDLFTPAARDRLTSGFATRVLVRVQLLRQNDPEPLAVAFQRVEIVYDIWDESFRVRTTRGPGTDRLFDVKTVDQALRAATALVQFPIEMEQALRPGEHYTLAVRGDLNPLSPELMGEVRRWLRQPAGTQRRAGSGGGDSFFGNFVTVFVNPQIEDSEHQVRFVSQTFEAPTR